MAKTSAKKHKSLIKLIKTAFSDLGQCEKIDLKGSYRLPEKKIQFPLDNYPLQLHIGSDAHVLHLYPEFNLGSKNNSEYPDYVLFDPEKFYSKISGFFRIGDGEKITLGKGEQQQRDFLTTSKKLPERQLSISNDRGKLTFNCHHPETGSCIAPLLKEKKLNKVNQWRQNKLERLAKILPPSYLNMGPKEALKLIQEVNQIMQNEIYREKDSRNQPGGVLKIPDKMSVVILGDLHGCLDNLLTILCQNNFLEAMDNQQACLIVLGDAVHPEAEGKYDAMESSQVIMDVIFRLKVKYPEQFFYLRGNHDSFCEELSKKGIPQGLLWAKQLTKERGKAYKKEMQRFYDSLAYLAYSKHFVSCHAGAPSSSVDLPTLINIHNHPKLINELTNKRFKTPNRMNGYTKGDIKKLRQALKLSEHTAFIVGHTPIDLEQTLWEHVGHVKHHYVVHAAHPKWVGVMAQIEGAIYPLVYPAETVSDHLQSISKKS